MRNLYMPINEETENVKSKDLEHSTGKPEIERGFIKDDNEFYEPGPTECRDEWGRVVTHQDSKSLPGR